MENKIKTKVKVEDPCRICGDETMYEDFLTVIRVEGRVKYGDKVCDDIFAAVICGKCKERIKRNQFKEED